jgi:gas vesicle protein
MTTNRTAIVAAAAGATLGAIVGLLLAPAAGRRTRRRLTGAMEDGRDAVLGGGRRAAGQVSDYLLGQFERSKQALRDAANG